GPLAQRVDLLRQVADRPLAIADELARVEGLLAEQDLEQGRLARAVLAQQADAVAAVDRGVDAVVEDLAAEALARVDQADHRRGVWVRGTVGVRSVANGPDLQRGGGATAGLRSLGWPARGVKAHLVRIGFCRVGRAFEAHCDFVGRWA